MSCAPILALDPGTTQTGWLRLHEGRVLECGVNPNADILRLLKSPAVVNDLLAIEMIASYGMAVGKDVFETCVWIGRYQQAWHAPDAVRFVYRQQVKLHLCQSARAKDPNVRQALLDLLGPQGTKKKPGPTYGVHSHMWAALGVAVTVLSLIEGGPLFMPKPAPVPPDERERDEIDEIFG